MIRSLEEIVVHDLAHLSQVASSLLAAFPDSRIFAISGEMGAGKTTLIKEFCRTLHVTDTVSSPTFALVYEYHTSGHAPVYHFDFYRINKEQEALDIGTLEYFNSGNYCFIEWPEKVINLLPEETTHLHIDVSDGKRIIRRL